MACPLGFFYSEGCLNLRPRYTFREGTSLENRYQQHIFKGIVGGIICLLIALNFQNCSGNNENTSQTIDPLSLEAVIVREKADGKKIVTGANPLRISKEYLFGLMSSDISSDVSLDVHIVSSTTAVCTLSRSAGSQVIYEGSCSTPGNLVLELVLHRPEKADAITSITLEVLDTQALGSDLSEFEFTGPTGELTALEEYRLNYTYKTTTPFVDPKFTTVSPSQIRCNPVAHPLGSYRFVCDRPGVWVVEGVQEGMGFAKSKSFEVVLPTLITPYFLVQVNASTSQQKLNLLTGTIPKASGTLDATLKFYKPIGVGSDVVFSLQLKSQTGTVCTAFGSPSGTYLKTIVCSGTGQATVEATVRWPGGLQRVGTHTLKIQ